MKLSIMILHGWLAPMPLRFLRLANLTPEMPYQTPPAPARTNTDAARQNSSTKQWREGSQSIAHSHRIGGLVKNVAYVYFFITQHLIIGTPGWSLYYDHPADPNCNLLLNNRYGAVQCQRCFVRVESIFFDSRLISKERLLSLGVRAYSAGSPALAAQKTLTTRLLVNFVLANSKT